MWNYIGESLMRRLKTDQHIYADIINQVERELVQSQIGGHEAAQRILAEIFDRR